MSDSEGSFEDDGPMPLPGPLEELKGENPTIWGFDYYNVIYATAASLAMIMAYLYTVIPDPEVK